MVAVVAQRRVVLPMIGQRQIAMLALEHVTACRTLDVRGKSAAIE